VKAEVGSGLVGDGERIRYWHFTANLKVDVPNEAESRISGGNAKAN